LVASGSAWWLLDGLACSYGCAWIGHVFFDENQPAAFKYPLFCFLGDWVM
jgi:hypothetical protein